MQSFSVSSVMFTKLFVKRHFVKRSKIDLASRLNIWVMQSLSKSLESYNFHHKLSSCDLVGFEPTSSDFCSELIARNRTAFMKVGCELMIWT